MLFRDAGLPLLLGSGRTSGLEPGVPASGYFCALFRVGWQGLGKITACKIQVGYFATSVTFREMHTKFRSKKLKRQLGRSKRT